MSARGPNASIPQRRLPDPVAADHHERAATNVTHQNVVEYRQLGVSPHE
jgi:hypothetical protein